MIASCAVPILATLLLATVAPWVAKRAAPRQAVWTLSIGGLLLALCSFAAVALMAFLLVGQLPPVARLGHWSARSVGLNNPYGELPLISAGTLVGTALIVLAFRSYRLGYRLGAAWSASRSAPDRLVVLEDSEPFAYAVPGWPGRIVASRGLLGSLDAVGRRAVLAHEGAHLRERHDLHQVAATVASCLNPGPSRPALRVEPGLRAARR